MSQDTKSLIRGAQQAIKLGQKPQARRLLQQALQQDPENFVGWLLLASVTTNPHTALVYISRAETLNPTSTTVQKAKAWAEARVPAERPLPKETAVETSVVWWKRPYLRGGAVAVVVLIVLAGLSAFLWNQAASQDRATAADAETGQIVAAAVQTNTPLNSGAKPVATTNPTAVAANAEKEAERETAVATPSAPVIQPKPISHQNSEPRPTWTLTPVPTPTPTPTNTPMPTFVAEQSGPVSRPYGVGLHEPWVDVNLTTQTLVAYEGDTPVLTTLISSGTWQHPTVTGQFRIYLTFASQTMDGRRLGYDYYLENVPYVMYFYEDYALHGTFWHNNFGTPMSHGCVNMRTSDAEWLYGWASIGTLVNVHY